MTAYWIEFLWIMLPSLMFMLVSAVPSGLSTLGAARHLSKRNLGPYLRNLWGSTAAGFVALGLLFGSLFGTDLSKSSTAAIIFVWVPIYSAIALGVGYALGGVAYHKLTRHAESVGEKAVITPGTRRFILVPVAMLSILLFGIVKYSIQHNDLALAERASDRDTLHRVYDRASRGEADSFGVPLFLAQNPNTPSDMLAKLSRHDHPAVRVFVAQHSNTAVEIVASLKNDCADFVRKAVEERLKLASGSNNSLQPTPSCGAAERVR